MFVLTLTLNPCVDRTLWQDGRVEHQSGGKGINVARVLHQLGVEHVAVAPAGGQGGALFAQLARQEGVTLEVLPIKDNTRMIDTYVQGEDLRQRVVREPSPQMTQHELCALRETVEGLLPGARVFCVCGSACTVAAAQVGAWLLRRAGALGIPTLLDGNGDMLSLGVKARPTLLKPNLKELGQLVGQALTWQTGEAAARALLVREGIDHVLLSLGEQGAVLVRENDAIYCPAPRVHTVNAVGSGDSFVAGYLYALLKGQSEWGALAYACAAGAANAAMFPAARVTKRDIEQIMGYAL